MNQRDFAEASLPSKVKRAVVHALCGAALAISSFASHSAPELGVYQWDVPTGPGNIESFSQWLGRPATVAAAFEARNSWDDIDGAAWQLGPWSQWVRAQAGRNLSLAVPMLPLSGGSLAACSTGQYDASWRNLANELAYHGLHWAYLRLGWEMDGSWFTWNATPGSGKETAFAGCFRRIVLVMRQAQPANQWKFVLNTATGWYSRAYLDAIWPGDAYVDVVALDLYDQSWAVNTYPYPNGCDAACRLTRQQNAWNSYSWHLYTIRDFALAHGKKVALPEWGVAIRPDGHGGGDNPYFIRKMHEFLHDPANNVAYHAYWNVSASDIDGRLTNSVQGDSPSGATRFPQAATLFKQLFGAPPPNTPPSVSFTSPASGQTVRETIGYAASATDNAGVLRVEFLLDGRVIATDSSAPYGGSLVTTTLANGAHTLRAIAYDAAGLSASSQVSINVQNSVTVPPPDTGTPGTQRTNVALASAGAVASASSTSSGYPASSIIDNVRTGASWGNGGGWGDGTSNAYPDWVQVSFGGGAKSIDRVVVYTLPDNYYANPGEPTDTTTFSLYGLVDFTVQGWNGSRWVKLATVTGNNLVKRTVTFPAFTTDRVRVQVTRALGGYSRITEVEAWGVAIASGPAANVALASAGAAASASTASAGYPAASIIDNVRTGATWGNGGGWGDSTSNTYPDWAQIHFGDGAKSIERVVVYTLPDNYYANPVEPTDTTSFSLHGIVDFSVQGWNGSAWVTLGTVAGNNLVKRTVAFPAFNTDRIRVSVTRALGGFSRITEVEAWGR